MSIVVRSQAARYGITSVILVPFLEIRELRNDHLLLFTIRRAPHTSFNRMPILRTSRMRRLSLSSRVIVRVWDMENAMTQVSPGLSISWFVLRFTLRDGVLIMSNMRVELDLRLRPGGAYCFSGSRYRQFYVQSHVQFYHKWNSDFRPQRVKHEPDYNLPRRRSLTILHICNH